MRGCSSVSFQGLTGSVDWPSSRYLSGQGLDSLCSCLRNRIFFSLFFFTTQRHLKYRYFKKHNLARCGLKIQNNSQTFLGKYIKWDMTKQFAVVILVFLPVEPRFRASVVHTQELTYNFTNRRKLLFYWFDSQFKIFTRLPHQILQNSYYLWNM